MMPTTLTPSRRVADATIGLGYHYDGAQTRYFAGDDLADGRNRLTREDLEAMRQEFNAGEWHRYGRPFELDDDLYQVFRIEWAGFTLDDWAKARGVPLTYAQALRRFLQQH
jgi:hypothetical protein